MTLAAALFAYQISERGPLLRTSALVALPPSMRQEMIEAYGRVSNRFAGVIADGITAGSIRPVDPMIGAQMFSATLNASAEYRWWVPGASGRANARAVCQAHADGFVRRINIDRRQKAGPVGPFSAGDPIRDRRALPFRSTCRLELLVQQQS